MGHQEPGAQRRTVGLPTPRDSTAPDLIGVVTFRLPETRPGRAPSQPRERRYPRDRQDATGRLLPLHKRPAPATPIRQPSCGAHSDEASSRVQSRSPVRSSPRLWITDGTRSLGLEPRASHPAVTGRARQGGDRSRTLTWGYVTDLTADPSNRRAHSTQATVASLPRCK